MAKVDAFMKSGGTIIFDTRDALQQGPGLGSTAGREKPCRSLLAALDIPELEPVPRDHVLTKTFYLMEKFPGRYDNGDTWVEALPAQTEDEIAERPAGSGRRRRLADHHHLERPRRRLGRRRRHEPALSRCRPAVRASASWPIAPASTS